MKNWNVLLLFFAIGCAPKISSHFEETKFVQNYSTHIINEPLQLYFKSPGDIEYVTQKQKLKKILKKQPIKFNDPVLVYGKENDHPYEYFVTVSEINNTSYPLSYIVFDTIIEQKSIRFIGRNLNNSLAEDLNIDLKNIFKSIEVGDSIRTEISTVMDVVNRYKTSNKYLKALREISEFPTYDKQEDWAKLQMELTFSSFLGENEFYEKYLKKLEGNLKLNDSISQMIKDDSVTDSQALNSIVEEAKNHQIVMINENHFFPNHRILVYELLPKLKALGYNYLALEALGNKEDSLLNAKNGYPILSSGFYTSEQNYGNLIRYAKDLGFQFVSYDCSDCAIDREVFQAETIFNKTFKNNPDTKVVVLAGIDHILEKPTKTGKKWMATIFKEKYGRDPLTISQTHLNKYRKEFKNKYVLINTKNFNDERMKSIDFCLLNNKPLFNNIWDASFKYENSNDMNIQVLLFYENEIEDDYDYHNKVPYFTTILKSEESKNLPIFNGKNIYLYALDKHGNRIDKQLIKSSQ